MSTQNQIASLTLGHGPHQIKIHAISTGKVAVRPSFKKKKGPGLLAKLNIFLDKRFTDFLPIYVYIIEHPEGIFVIDTGENANVLKPDYFKDAKGLSKVFNEKHIRFEIKRQDEIGPQLESLGISTNQVNKLILTHLHLDHTDGLHYFPKTEILLPRKESEKPYGDTPFLYPSWFQPSLFDWQHGLDFPFKQYYPITRDGNLFAVPTPGHTFGHCSVVLRHEGYYYFFAGDITYDEPQLVNDVLPGAQADFRASRKTMAKIRQITRHDKLIYLPSHDPEAGLRLMNQITTAAC